MKVCISLPVYKDDTGDEKGHSYGKKVRERHVVRVPLGRALLCGVIGEGDIVVSIITILPPAALLQCVVSVIPIIHHGVCKIALRTEGEIKACSWIYGFLPKLRIKEF